MKLNMLALTLATVISLGPAIADAQQQPPYQSPPYPTPAQQPSPQQTPVQPTSPAEQQAPAQQMPAEPATPAQQPSPEQAPNQPVSPEQQPSPQPAPMTQAPEGPTMTVEGTVTGVKTLSCEQASGSAAGSTIESAGGCHAIVEIAPGATWADTARAESLDHGGVPLMGIPVRVVVAATSAIKTRDSTVSPMDLKPGSTVRVDYQVVNDLNIATNVAVTELVR